MADLTGHAIFVSRQFLELHLAESADEYLGKCSLGLYGARGPRKVRTFIITRRLRMASRRDVEYSFFRTDGTRFPGELSSALVKDASGKPMGIMSVLRDITERKLAEEALRRK